MNDAVEKAKFLCFMYAHRDFLGVWKMCAELNCAFVVLP